MLVRLDLSAVRATEWYEFAIRFALGGLATALAGAIASVCGPAVGGLFLAFPAIFPASATLIEKHERKRKERLGCPGARRGKDAAALESAGAAMGSLGLVAFGAVVGFIPPGAVWLAFPSACAAWLIVSLGVWWLRRLRPR